MDKVSREIAEQEVNSWIEHKKMSNKRKEEKKDSIESLISYVQEGIISVDPSTFEIIQNLNFEIGEQIKIPNLKWKPFGNVGRVQLHMKNVDSTDFTGNCIAHACAQTGQSKNIINNLDSEDAVVMKVLAVFFM